MPAYSFQERFVPKVESGEKTHTIRGKRKARRKPGQRFVGYYAQRTKQCRKLVESVITRVQDIFMFVNRDGDVMVDVDGERIALDECESLAVRDGFESWEEMKSFWVGRYPFDGDLIHWRPPSAAGNGGGR
jgi:uncharacterized protein YqfB (UPF0267 family)